MVLAESILEGIAPRFSFARAIPKANKIAPTKKTDAIFFMDAPPVCRFHGLVDASLYSVQAIVVTGLKTRKRARGAAFGVPVRRGRRGLHRLHILAANLKIEAVRISNVKTVVGVGLRIKAATV